jgi:hypothetical protein
MSQAFLLHEEPVHGKRNLSQGFNRGHRTVFVHVYIKRIHGSHAGAA